MKCRAMTNDKLRITLSNPSLFILHLFFWGDRHDDGDDSSIKNGCDALNFIMKLSPNDSKESQAMT